MLRYSEDRFPVVIISLGLILTLLPFVYSSNFIYLLAGVGLILRFLAPIHQHSHGHLSIFTKKIPNHLYDIILMCAGGYTTAMWKIHHNIGHHIDFLDPSVDFGGNDRFGKNIPFKRFVFTVFGDAMTIIDCFKILQKKNLLKSSLREQLLTQLTIQLVIYASLFVIDWKSFLIFIYLPNRLYRWGIFWTSFGQHEDMPMTDVYSSSQTNFSGNKYVFNVGFHTAHHDRPSLHWSKLEAHTYKILHRIPRECLIGNTGKQSSDVMVVSSLILLRGS